jgi:hypothetical protein
MRKIIRERYGIANERFVEFEILDYGVALNPPLEHNLPCFNWNLVYAGNCDAYHIGSWVQHLPRTEKVHYEFFGPNWSSNLSRRDIEYKGLLGTQDELADYISRNAHFGIIAAGPGTTKYYDYTSTSKFGSYMCAGVPIIVSSQCRYIASLVRKYEIGIVLDSFGDLPALVRDVSEMEYAGMRNHCLRLGAKIRTGHFFKRVPAEIRFEFGRTLSTASLSNSDYARSA